MRSKAKVAPTAALVARSWRTKLGSLLTPCVARSLDWLALGLRLLPRGRRAFRGVSVARDVRYRPQGPGERRDCGLLDIVRPWQAAGVVAAASGPGSTAPGSAQGFGAASHATHGQGGYPLVVYVHGGGFAFCSKETHGLVAAELAGHGFVVANVNYRRVPAHPCPAALQDVAQAIVYCVANAHSWGAQADALVLMGESAGANLVLAQTLALALERARAPAWALPLHQAGIRVRAVLPACGLLDVQAPERFRAVTPVPSAYAQARIAAVCASYALSAENPGERGGVDDAGAWASPLQLLESAPGAFAPLPPTWIGVGEADPILDDSLRLARALTARQDPCELARFAGRGHAFFAIPERAHEEAFWQQASGFIRRALAAAPTRGPG